MTYHPETYDDIPERLRPKTLADALNPTLRNVRDIYRRQKEHNKVLAWPECAPEFREPECATCMDGREVRLVSKSGEFLGYSVCPDCRDLVLRRQRALINRRWPITDWERELAALPWQRGDFGMGRQAPAAEKARAAQQAILSEMPSSRTLLLYGQPGVGKTRLIAEIVVTARTMELSAIMRSAERLRDLLILPYGMNDDEERNDRQRRADLAWKDLCAADVLAIDEVDHSTGKTINEKFLELLNHRIANRLTTCIVGNDVREKLPKVLMSRLEARGNLHVDMSADADARPYLGHGGTV